LLHWLTRIALTVAAGLMQDCTQLPSGRGIKALKKELTQLVTARGSTLLELTGIGPSSAARLLVDVGDIHHFADRDRFAS
jgi:transposase